MSTRLLSDEYMGLEILRSVFNRPRRWVAHRYKGWRALARTIIAWLMYRLAFYKDYSHVDWQRVERIIFVCEGNICRSPYAEYKTKSLGVIARSCGLSANGTASADHNAVRVALERGIDLTTHVSCNVIDMKFLETDLILVMQPEQTQFLDTAAMKSGAQVALLGIVGGGSRPYITDPYGADLIFFRKCFDWIDEAVGNAVIESKADQHSAS